MPSPTTQRQHENNGKYKQPKPWMLINCLNHRQLILIGNPIIILGNGSDEYIRWLGILLGAPADQRNLSVHLPL